MTTRTGRDAARGVPRPTPPPHRTGVDMQQAMRRICNRTQDDSAEATLIRRTAAWLRQHLDQGVRAGVSNDADVEAIAALLDILATELTHLAPAIRRLA